MPSFLANYPNAERKLLSTAERLKASPKYTGRGVVIAYLDSGFYMHPDIADRVRLHVDATTNHIEEQDTVLKSDVTSWHGLMVSAIGSGNGVASNGQYRAIACDSELVLVKISNPHGGVKEHDIMRGMAWLVANHARFHIKIVNVSVGGDAVSRDPQHPLHESVKKLIDAGVSVVIAAGNRGDKRLVPPASSPQAIIVGGYSDNNSLNRNEWRAYHSNYGHAYDGSAKPDLIAPAQWIASPILPGTIVEKQARWLGSLLEHDNKEAIRNLLNDGLADLDIAKPKTARLGKPLMTKLQEGIHDHKLINDAYQHVDGTSVAAPIVSSVIAQMLEANPALSPVQIRQILVNTAIPLDSMPSEQQGGGTINPQYAIEMAERMRKSQG